MTKAISLLSGGLDSAVATMLAMEGVEVALAITLDYGQRAAAREIEAAQAFCSIHGIEHRVVETPWLGELGSSALTHGSALPQATPEGLDEGAAERARAVWVPNRNGLFIAIAGSFAESTGASRIVVGFNAEEAKTFPDNGVKFIEATDAALRLSTLARVNLLSPTARMTKQEIAGAFISLDIDPGTMWSCYESGELMCGRCESCARTIRAFRAQGAWQRIAHRFEGTAR